MAGVGYMVVAAGASRSLAQALGASLSVPALCKISPPPVPALDRKVALGSYVSAFCRKLQDICCEGAAVGLLPCRQIK